MKKKYFFFDIDGTLTVSQLDHTFPQSTLNTLKQLEANGHFVAIATGRSYIMAQTAMKMTGIQNASMAGGDCVVYHGEIIQYHYLNRDDCITILDEAVEKKIPYAYFDDSKDTIHSPNKDYYSLCDDNLASDMHCVVDPELDYHDVARFQKIFLYIDDATLDTFESRHLIPYLRFYKDCLVFEHDDKYSGILKLVQLEGGNEEDVVVFGDGKNDIEMMKKAPFSIAMGNGVEPLKEIASFVTKRSEDDGIEYACRHFGWVV